MKISKIYLLKQYKFYESCIEVGFTYDEEEASAWLNEDTIHRDVTLVEEFKWK